MFGGKKAKELEVEEDDIEMVFRIFPNPYLRKCLVAFLYDSGSICCFVHKIL